VIRPAKASPEPSGPKLTAERQDQEQQNPEAAQGKAQDGGSLITIDHQADDAQQHPQGRSENNSHPAKGGNGRASTGLEEGDQDERRQRNCDDGLTDAPDAALVHWHDRWNGTLHARRGCVVHKQKGLKFHLDRFAAHFERLQVEVDGNSRFLAL
jgi:hypothetical protein